MSCLEEAHTPKRSDAAHQTAWEKLRFLGEAQTCSLLVSLEVYSALKPVVRSCHHAGLGSGDALSLSFCPCESHWFPMR